MRHSTVLLIPLIVLSILFVAKISIAEQTSASWVKIYDQGEPKVLFYDVNKDGVNEIVTNEFMLSGNSPLYFRYSEIAKINYEGNGYLDLVQYVPDSGKLFILMGNSSLTLTAPINSHLVPHTYGFQIGNVVYGRSSQIVLPSNISAAPVVIDGKLYATLIDNNGLVLYDGSHENVIYPLSSNNMVVDAGYDEGTKTLYVIVTSNTSSALIVYNVNSSDIKIQVFNFPISKAFFINGLYIAVSNGIFEIEPGNDPIIINPSSSLVYPIENVSNFAILSSNEIDIYKVEGNNISLVLQLPSLNGIESIDYSKGEVIASASDGIYYIGEKFPTVSLKFPDSIIAGQNFSIQISGNFDSVHLTVAGQEYNVKSPTTIITTINTVGNQTILVKAYKGSFSTTYEYNMVVLTRPININIVAPNSVKPYQPFNISLSIFDNITGKAPTAFCYISIPAENRTITVNLPFDTVQLTAIPIGLEVPINIYCSGPLYGTVSKSISIPISDYYYTVNLTYLGAGKFVAYAYNIYTNDPFGGRMIVAVDGGNHTVINNNGTFTVSPGSHTVSINLTKDNIVYGKAQFTVQYYDDISKVPPSVSVVVGDRVQYITKYVNYTTTVTVSSPVPIEKVNIPTTVGVLALGIGLGVLLWYLLPPKLVKSLWKK